MPYDLIVKAIILFLLTAAFMVACNGAAPSSTPSPIPTPDQFTEAQARELLESAFRQSCPNPSREDLIQRASDLIRRAKAIPATNHWEFIHELEGTALVFPSGAVSGELVEYINTYYCR